MARPRSARLHGDADGFRAALASLVDSPQFSDVTFLVGRERRKVFAHRCILACRCPGLRGLLDSPPPAPGAPAPAPIALSSAQPEAFLAVLEFLYTNRVHLTSVTALEVLASSVEYGLDDLRQLCVEFVMGTLSVETACEALQAAATCGQVDLQQRCLAFIEDNTQVGAGDAPRGTPSPAGAAAGEAGAALGVAGARARGQPDVAVGAAGRGGHARLPRAVGGGAGPGAAQRPSDHRRARPHRRRAGLGPRQRRGVRAPRGSRGGGAGPGAAPAPAGTRRAGRPGEPEPAGPAAADGERGRGLALPRAAGQRGGPGAAVPSPPRHAAPGAPPPPRPAAPVTRAGSPWPGTPWFSPAGQPRLQQRGGAARLWVRLRAASASPPREVAWRPRLNKAHLLGLVWDLCLRAWGPGWLPGVVVVWGEQGLLCAAGAWGCNGTTGGLAHPATCSESGTGGRGARAFSGPMPWAAGDAPGLGRGLEGEAH